MLPLAQAKSKEALCKASLVKGQAMKGTRGGPRHFRKPYVVPGLLFSILNRHKEVLNDLKAYEHLSSGSGVEPKAIGSLQRFAQGTCVFGTLL